jgi:hypothetical protein
MIAGFSDIQVDDLVRQGQPTPSLLSACILYFLRNTTFQLPAKPILIFVIVPKRVETHRPKRTLQSEPSYGINLPSYVIVVSQSFKNKTHSSVAN